jgi:hypothetical protein
MRFRRFIYGLKSCYYMEIIIEFKYNYVYICQKISINTYIRFKTVNYEITI